MTPETLQLARNLRNSVRNGRRKQNGWGWLKRLRLRSYLDVRPSWGWVEQLREKSIADLIFVDIPVVDVDKLRRQCHLPVFFGLLPAVFYPNLRIIRVRDINM